MTIADFEVSTRRRGAGASHGRPVGGIWLWTGVAGLRAEVHRVAAAVDREVCEEPGGPERRRWDRAQVVLLDRAAAIAAADFALPRRARVVLLCPGDPGAADWEAAVRIGAERVLALPAASAVLVDLLAEPVAARRTGGAAVGVIGGRGGAGASTLAAAVALVGPEAGRPSLLVDVDPLGGGLDVLLGIEDVSGLRWPDIAVEGGRIGVEALCRALPAAGGVPVLSGTRSDAGPIRAAALGSVIDAGVGGGQLVVCDLPRTFDDACVTALERCDLIVVTVPADVRGCASTAVVLERLRPIASNVGVVVRGPAPGGLVAADIADVLELPLLAAVRAEPSLSEHVERGGLRMGRRSQLSRAARAVIDAAERAGSGGAA